MKSTVAQNTRYDVCRCTASTWFAATGWARTGTRGGAWWVKAAGDSRRTRLVVRNLHHAACTFAFVGDGVVVATPSRKNLRSGADALAGGRQGLARQLAGVFRACRDEACAHRGAKQRASRWADENRMVHGPPTRRCPCRRPLTGITLRLGPTKGILGTPTKVEHRRACVRTGGSCRRSRLTSKGCHLESSPT